MPLRNEFPPAGSDYLDGASDGYEYRTTFARKKKILTLCIYNEEYPDHLLRFHRVLERRPAVSTPTETEPAVNQQKVKKQQLEEV